MQKLLRGPTIVTANNQSVIGEDKNIRFRGAGSRSLDFPCQRKAGSNIGNPFPAQSGEPFRKQRYGIVPDGQRNSVYRMHVQYYPMPQHAMHGGLNGTPQPFPGLHGILTSRIGVLPHASSCVGKIYGNKDLVVPGMCQPLAGSFDPEDSVDLNRRVSCTGLHKQRIAPQARR